uniref:pendrin-like n=1 Tax=Oncorhynchus gorbuscha TaxID=8017 RepID=UPI001EAF8657|nr:pendrin-like [Oncorhynchus gorbuscha]
MGEKGLAGSGISIVALWWSLAYALLVSVAPVYRLYSAFFPILTYFLLGTSRHISVGPFPVTCLMVGSVVLTLAPDNHFLLPGNGTGVNGTEADGIVVDVEAMEAQRIMVASSMTVLVGLFQLKIVLSVPTNNHSDCFSILCTLIDVFTNIRQTNRADLVAGLLTIVFVMAVKEVNTKFRHKIPVPIPIEVIVTVVATGISYATALESHYGASIVHSIPRGRAQELIAFGFSNVFCGCFSGFVASTALSRTAVQESTGGKSQMAGIISAVMVMIVILALGHLLEPLQKSVPAAIVIANLKGMFMQVTEVPTLWRQNRADCFIWLATCLASVVSGLDVGLPAGLLFEMGTVLVRTQLWGLTLSECSRRGIKALKKIHKLIKKRKLRATEVSLGVGNKGFESERNSGRESGQMEDGDWPVPEVEVHVDWAMELSVRVSVPKVQLHSLVLDFSAVSFLDVVAVKSLRQSLTSSYALESMSTSQAVTVRTGQPLPSAFGFTPDGIVWKMEALAFFDLEVIRDVLFLSVHDAILFIKLETANGSMQDAMVEGLSLRQDCKEPPPFTEEEDLIETYDNQHRSLIHRQSMESPINTETQKS